MTEPRQRCPFHGSLMEADTCQHCFGSGWEEIERCIWCDRGQVYWCDECRGEDYGEDYE